MNNLIKLVPAVLLAFSAAAAADDFPPFFPAPGQGSGGQTAPQPGGGQTGGTAVNTGTGIYIPQPSPGPQQPPVQNPQPQPMPQGSILGKWGAYMGGASMEFVFNPDGTGMVINNGQSVNFFYGIQGNTLILCDDRNCSTGANQFMFALSGNVLYLNVNGQNIAYQRVGAAGPAPQPLPPQPQALAGLSGSYTCQIPGNPQMVLTHEFAGNVYRVYLSQGNMPKNLIEVGSYTLNGSQFNYTVQQSPNQQTVGTSGTNMIQFNGNGYVMTLNGGSLNCVRSF